MTMYAHLITIFRKIDPEKLYWEFTYFEERSFQSAAFGARKKELFTKKEIIEYITVNTQITNFKCVIGESKIL